MLCVSSETSKPSYRGIRFSTLADPHISICARIVQGDTSSIECAHQLGKLCEKRRLVVNLIPYNATDVKDKHQCPSNEHMQQFRDIVASYGTFCTIRRTMGADIASACGQLVQTKDNEEEEAREERDIEDAVGMGSMKRDEAASGPLQVRAESSEKGEDSNPKPHPASPWLGSLPSED
jgi:hypothetical protein